MKSGSVFFISVREFILTNLLLSEPWLGVSCMPVHGSLPCDLFDNFEVALDGARQGERKELGILLDVYRSYLMSIASKELSRGVVAKVAPSDIVQETLMQASRSFGGFQGSSEPELRAWLKKILARKVIDTHRHYQDFAMRDVSREVPFFEAAREKDQWLYRKMNRESSGESTEKVGVLSELLGHLSEEQRTAIQLRTFEKLSFEDVGKRMGRTTEAARKIWSRAIQQMSKEFRANGFGA
jgi:RNA polymerase sigma-70 factor (ECF subfamily)